MRLDENGNYNTRIAHSISLLMYETTYLKISTK